MFVRRFPTRLASAQEPRGVDVATASAGVLGALLVVTEMSDRFWPIAGGPGADFRMLVTRRGGSFYWPLLMAASAPALAYLVWKARAARPADKRRIRVFVAGLVIGFWPITLAVLLEVLVPGYAKLVTNTAMGWWVDRIVLLSLMTLPLVTAYSRNEERSPLLDGLITPLAAQQGADGGFRHFKLYDRPDWKPFLASPVRPLTPRLVARLDRDEFDDMFYYLVPFGLGERDVSAVARVDAVSGKYLEGEARGKSGSSWAPAIYDEPRSDKILWLVWKPCVESRSTFMPFRTIHTGTGTEYQFGSTAYISRSSSPLGPSVNYAQRQIPPDDDGDDDVAAH